MIDIATATKQELIEEYEAMEAEWGKWSCESFGFYLSALHKRIVELGGWDTDTETTP